MLSYLSWMMYLYVVGHKTSYDSNYKDWYKYNYKVESKNKPRLASLPAKDNNALPLAKFNYKIENKTKPPIESLPVKNEKAVPFAKYNYKVVNKNKPRFASLPTKTDKVIPLTKYNYPVVNKSEPRFASLPTKKELVTPLVLNKGINNQERIVTESKLITAVTRINIVKADTAKIKKSQRRNIQMPDLANQIQTNVNQPDNNIKDVEKTISLANNVESFDAKNTPFMITQLKKPDEVKVSITEGQNFEVESMSKTTNLNNSDKNLSPLDFQEGNQPNQFYAVNRLSNDEYLNSNQMIISSLTASINNGPMRATGVGTQDGFDAGTGAVDNTGKYNDSAGSGGALPSLPLPDGNILMALFGMLYASMKFIFRIKFNKSKSE